MISNYIQRKRDGFVEIELEEGKLKVKSKRFDEMTGEEEELEIEEISIEDLERERVIRQNQVVELTALIDDLKKL